MIRRNLERIAARLLCVRLGPLFICRERPGVISRGACWVAIEDCYLYVASTLPGLLWLLATERRHDRHLVG